MPPRSRPTSGPSPYLEPRADGFRNYYSERPSALSPANALVDKADLLDLTVPEMTVLVAGMRTLDANAGVSSTACSRTQTNALDNDFFVNLLDMNTVWVRRRTANMSSKAAIASPAR
jgi:catalase-peroxidase